jgi:hypothetical protein
MSNYPFVPYNENTATTEDRIAWALCQIIDDDAPMRWTRYRFTATCIATNPELMALLCVLRDSERDAALAAKEP